MKLLSIRLHPFGASMDRPFALHPGLNVVEGPNEFGKSTLVHALWHALQTPTKLTPARLRDTMGRWYPQPAGDHARVTLRFEADGAVWTLEKTWGAGGASRLQADGAAAMADPATVQAKLHKLLRLNTATWQQVLFTRQAQLAGTVEQLAKHGGTLDDVHALLQGAAAIPGDIAAEKLMDRIEDRIKIFYHRWDRSNQGPSEGRGLDRPWALGEKERDNHLVLRAWYDQERLRRTLQEVIAHERALDAVNDKMHELAALQSVDADFIRQGKDLRQGLSQREGLEERVTRLTNEEKDLMAIVTAWPRADQVIAANDGGHKRLGENLTRLEAELAAARQHVAAETLRQGYQRLMAAKASWEEAKQKLATTPAVDPQDLKDLKKLEQQIGELRIQIDAQKLLAELECSSECSITVQRGTEAPETIVLGPATLWKGEAAGKFTVEAGDLRLSVQSGMEDVEALFTKLAAAQGRQVDGLDKLGHGTLAAAEAAAKAHDELAREVKTKEGLYDAALQGRTAEQWTADMQAQASLPQTRALPVLEQEKNEALAEQARLKAEADTERRKVEQWKKEHGDVASLMEKVIDRKGQLQQATKDLAALPALPAGFSTVADYLQQLEARERAQESVKAELDQAMQERARLEATTPERTAEDLRAELELKEREFQRRLAEGEALLRIRRKLEAVIAARGEGDPLQGLTDTIATRFNALTEGRYTGVKLDGTAPAQVSGPTSLPTGLLSQGTLGSLALATRLALAELYLKDDDGFLLLDDPFIDMDPARRTAAAGALAAFANERQVLLLTCHPGHARELVEAGGAELKAG